jgi:hypothetical protein
VSNAVGAAGNSASSAPIIGAKTEIGKRSSSEPTNDGNKDFDETKESSVNGYPNFEQF